MTQDNSKEENLFSRTEMLLGSENMERLAQATVAVFGIGGVGGYVVEALVRSGVGSLVLVDSDVVSPSNCNRQIIATQETIGRYKVDVMRERVLSINPQAKVEARQCFYLPQTADAFDFSTYSYVVDAVDTVSAKLEIITRAQAAGVPVISSMGAGNKLDPTKFRVADIYETSVCPLAKVMRHECRKRGIEHLKVVYSTEEPVRLSVVHDSEEEALAGGQEKADSRRPAKAAPGSVAFVPSVAGLILVGEVVKDIIYKD